MSQVVAGIIPKAVRIIPRRRWRLASGDAGDVQGMKSGGDRGAPMMLRDRRSTSASLRPATLRPAGFAERLAVPLTALRAAGLAAFFAAFLITRLAAFFAAAFFGAAFFGAAFFTAFAFLAAGSRLRSLGRSRLPGGRGLLGGLLRFRCRCRWCRSCRGRCARGLVVHIEIEVEFLAFSFEVAQVRPTGEIVIRQIHSIVIKIRHGYASCATTQRPHEITCGASVTIRLSTVNARTTHSTRVATTHATLRDVGRDE